MKWPEGTNYGYTTKDGVKVSRYQMSVAARHRFELCNYTTSELIDRKKAITTKMRQTDVRDFPSWYFVAKIIQSAIGQEIRLRKEVYLIPKRGRFEE